MTQQLFVEPTTEQIVAQTVIIALPPFSVLLGMVFKVYMAMIIVGIPVGMVLSLMYYAVTH